MSKTDNVRGYEDKKTINWYPGHMAKTKREIAEKLDLIDVVYEVIDARMPLSSKIIDLDTLIKDKPRILIMTKYDLCDKNVTNQFIKYYEELGYKVVPLDLTNQKLPSKVIEVSDIISKEVNLKREAKGLRKRAIRALIVGVPNVGKSTLINRLVGKKATQVGDRPGVTKNLGWIRINKDIELLDSPGILWPKMANQEQAHILASLSSIKEEILDEYDLTMFILRKLSELYPEKLDARYGVTNIDFDDIDDTFMQIAKRRGALQKGGGFDYEKVCSIIIKDLKTGLLGEITLDRIEDINE